MKGLSRKGWFEGGGLWGTICPGVGAPYPRLPSYICLQDDEDDDDVSENYEYDDDVWMWWWQRSGWLWLGWWHTNLLLILFVMMMKMMVLMWMMITGMNMKMYRAWWWTHKLHHHPCLDTILRKASMFGHKSWNQDMQIICTPLNVDCLKRVKAEGN